MRPVLAFLCLSLAGCGLNEDFNRAELAKLSDAELMTANANVNRPLSAHVLPQHREWVLDEMKRRGLIGPGRDGTPKQ